MHGLYFLHALFLGVLVLELPRIVYSFPQVQSPNDYDSSSRWPSLQYRRGVPHVDVGDDRLQKPTPEMGPLPQSRLWLPMTSSGATTTTAPNSVFSLHATPKKSLAIRDRGLGGNSNFKLRSHASTQTVDRRNRVDVDSLMSRHRFQRHELAQGLNWIQSAIEAWWWTFPMILAFLPAYRWIIHSAPTVTPHWWKMTCMEYIRRSPDAVAVVSVFLLSNISYFLASACFFFLPESKTETKSTMSLKAVLPIQALAKASTTPNAKPQQYADLACWILACGFVSTAFHSLQALGTSMFAEAACFVDHGVALTAGLYFWHVCGMPRRKRIYIIGGAGMVALSLPLQPGYAWLHSAWHVLSAISALFWGLQKRTDTTNYLSDS